MNVTKITISIDSKLLKKTDLLVKEGVFQNRSQAFQSAVSEKISRLNRNRLARECAKLDVNEERALADLGLVDDVDAAKAWTLNKRKSAVFLADRTR